MSLLDYDKGMYSKIMGVYDEVIFADPSEAFKINASKHGGQVLLPFISVWRLPEFTINRVTYNDIRVRKGDSFRMGTEQTSQIRNFRGMPVTLTYQIDIYSNKRVTCDGITSELLLHLTESPYVNVRIEDADVSFTHQFEIVVSDSVNDNTSISDFEDTGRFYRLTIEAVLNEAIIYRIDTQDRKIVEKVLVDVNDWTSGEVVESYIDTETYKDTSEEG